MSGNLRFPKGFLFKYLWEGKAKEQIIEEMQLQDYEQEYLEEAMKQLEQEKDFSGFELIRRIDLLIDMNTEEEDFDEDDFEPIR